MHFTSTLTILSLALAISASPTGNVAAKPVGSFTDADATYYSGPQRLSKRGCFSGGENWGADKVYALADAQAVCNGGFAGTYAPGDIRAVCYNLDSTKKVDFSLQLRSDVAERTIEYDECYDGLQKEINGCDNGGSTEYSNWIYTADPNAGQCA